MIHEESVSWQHKSVILSPMFPFLLPLPVLNILWHLTIETKLARFAATFIAELTQLLQATLPHM